MNHSNKNTGTPVQPSLAEMFAGFMARQSEAAAAGLAAPEVGDVVPFEAAPVQPVDARLAWDEAQTTAGFFQAGCSRQPTKPPSEWASLVTSHEPVAAIAFAAGNFPQLVRDLHGLMASAEAGNLRSGSSLRPLAASGLENWADAILAENGRPQALLAIGVLRLARHFDAAHERLEKHAGSVPEEWRAAWDNERAALAWHQGRLEEAAALWQTQPESVPVLFNRGMAALFLGRPDQARSALGRVVAQIPDDNAWHHLGQLYLALAEMRSLREKA